MSKLIGKVHNAKVCTIDGRDCWIASVNDGQGRFLHGAYGATNVSEHQTKEAAIKWLRTELKARGVEFTIE